MIEAALSECPLKVRAKFLERMGGFRDQPQHLWNGNRSKMLTGCQGILEIRFDVKNVVYRPLGFFGPGEREFTLLLWALEKGNKFIPKNAPELAQARMAEVKSIPGASHVANF